MFLLRRSIAALADGPPRRKKPNSNNTPVRIKYIPSLALILARQRSPTAKPLGKNWPRAFEKRHPELKARTVKAIDWKRYSNNTYPKIVEWFEVIRSVIQDLVILPKNVYNIDKTGIILSMLGLVKVLVGKDNLRKH